MNITAISPQMAEVLQRFEEESPLYKQPLTRRFYANQNGGPLKTVMAERFPLLSRRERRELMRALEKVKAKV